MKARAQVHLRPADDPSAQVVKCDIHESCDLQVLVIVTGYTFFHGCFFELNIWPLQPLGKSFPERLSGFSEAICKHQMRRCPKNGFDTEFLDAANIPHTSVFSVVRGFSADTASNKLRQSVTCSCWSFHFSESLCGGTPVRISVKSSLTK